MHVRSRHTLVPLAAAALLAAIPAAAEEREDVEVLQVQASTVDTKLTMEKATTC